MSIRRVLPLCLKCSNCFCSNGNNFCVAWFVHISQVDAQNYTVNWVSAYTFTCCNRNAFTFRWIETAVVFCIKWSSTGYTRLHYLSGWWKCIILTKSNKFWSCFVEEMERLKAARENKTFHVTSVDVQLNRCYLIGAFISIKQKHLQCKGDARSSSIYKAGYQRRRNLAWISVPISTKNPF